MTPVPAENPLNAEQASVAPTLDPGCLDRHWLPSLKATGQGLQRSARRWITPRQLRRNSRNSQGEGRRNPGRGRRGGAEGQGGTFLPSASGPKETTVNPSLGTPCCQAEATRALHPSQSSPSGRQAFPAMMLLPQVLGKHEGRSSLGVQGQAYRAGGMDHQGWGCLASGK